MKILYEPDAEQELSDAAAYVANRASSVAVAEQLLLEVAKAEQLVSEYPNAQPVVRGGFRRCLLDRFQYQLVDRVEPDVIRVIAFAHLKRKPGYWRKRDVR